MTATDPRPMSPASAILYAIGSPLTLLALVFLPYRARSRFQPGTKRWDLILLAVVLPAMVVEIPLAALDAGQMGCSNVPLWVVVAGYVLLIGSIAVTTWGPGRQSVPRAGRPHPEEACAAGDHVRAV